MEAVCIPDILQGHVLDEWNKGTEQSFQSRYQYWIRLLAENCGNTGADTGHASEIYLGTGIGTDIGTRYRVLSPCVGFKRHSKLAWQWI